MPGVDARGARRLVSTVGGRRLEVVHDGGGTRITLHHSWRTVGAAVALRYSLLVVGTCGILGATVVACAEREEWLPATILGGCALGMAITLGLLVLPTHRLFRGVPTVEVKKMLHDNCKALYHLDDIPDRLPATA